MENFKKLFVSYKIFKDKNGRLLVKNLEHIVLIDGYLDMDIKLSIIQNTTTKTIKLCYSNGPKYCIGSSNTFSKQMIYKKTNIPKKYEKHFNKLKLLYNNYLEQVSKDSNQTLILLF